jgi:hypothetical protein
LAKAGVSLPSNLAVAGHVANDSASKIKLANATRDFMISVVGDVKLSKGP